MDLSLFPNNSQPSPIWQSGRPTHRPFRGLFGFTRVTACTLTLPLYFVGRFTEGLNRFVTSTAAQVASGWSISPGVGRTHREAPPFHGARQKLSFALLRQTSRNRTVRWIWESANGRFAPLRVTSAVGSDAASRAEHSTATVTCDFASVTGGTGVVTT